jgi:hypothetical protein
MRTNRHWAQGVALFVSMGIAAVAWAAGEEVLLLGGLTLSAANKGLPDGWKPLTFKNIAATTRYSVVPDGAGFVLKAESRAAASGLYRPVDLAPTVYPILAWRWKVENILAKGDERRKEGDDYAARIYVAFQYDPGAATLWEKTRYGTYRLFYGEYPPKAVINYIWANRLPKGAASDNAFTDRAKMIAVQSGPQEIGRWLSEERNLYEDYRRLFGQEPPRIAGIALMTDTDNTGESAVAYYDQIVLRPAR